MESEKIFMSKEEYEKHLAQIDKVKQELADLNMGRKDAYDAGSGDGWDSPEFEEIERRERVLLGILERLFGSLPNIEIVERHNEEGVVDFGNIVRIDAKYPDEEEPEEEIMRLVGALSEEKIPGVFDVTMSSPRGQAMYRKTVGDVCKYLVDGEIITVTIKEIVPTDKLVR